MQAANPDIDISIIVVNWNVCELLAGCLTAIQQHAGLDPRSFEVRIIDNNSADDSVAMVRERFPGYHLTVNSENTGFARANNQAYAECRGRHILLLNPDTEIWEGAIAKMLAVLDQHPQAGILGARLLNSDGSFQRAAGGALPTLANVAWHYLFLARLLPSRWSPPPTFMYGDPQGTFPVGWVSGAAMMLRREAVGQRIFDESFFLYGEDLELCHRMHAAGWKVMYTSAATVLHHLRRSTSRHGSAEILASPVKGNRAYFRRHNGRLRTWLYDLLLTVGYLARWPCFRILSILKQDATGFGGMATASRLYARASFTALLRCGR